eukprot:TRINITY_DN5071_c0_g2_i1.p2 TRINITY_DN5071_c0_g2~~TRINITY_DN5071_c0_g2_i1.p2  ORF type:complete len:104 (-),score=21.46 TRINITY_DN5071_c0_g2_i1:371-682(-)
MSARTGKGGPYVNAGDDAALRTIYWQLGLFMFCLLGFIALLIGYNAYVNPETVRFQSEKERQKEKDKIKKDIRRHRKDLGGDGNFAGSRGSEGSGGSCAGGDC